MAKSILIRGGGFVNKGAEAMVYTARQQLASRLRGSVFYTAFPPGVSGCGADGDFRDLPTARGGRARKMMRLAGASLASPGILPNAVRQPWTTLQAVAQIDGVDAAVDVSGYSYADPWGVWPSRYTWTYVRHAAARGKPYVFLPQAWGPFENREIARLVRRFLARAARLYARDGQSLGDLRKLGGRGRPRLAPDIAFRFQSAPDTEGARALSDLGVGRGGRPIMALAPNMRVYERVGGEGMENAYVRTLAAVARYARGRDAAVVLIPHEIRPGNERRDDRFLCDLLARCLDDPAVVSLAPPWTAARIKSVIARVDLLVGSRFHSLVAALSSAVPVVVVGWSHKYAELMRSVGMDSYVLRHDRLGEEEFLERVGQAWGLRASLREQLAQRVADIQRQVDALFDEVAELIDGASS